LRSLHIAARFPVFRVFVYAVLTGVTRHLRKPEPARQARSPPGIRLPQPRKPAQARPRRSSI